MSKPSTEEAAIGCAAQLALGVVGYTVEGWVLWTAWRWWLLDLGLPPLPYGTAVVIVFLAGMLGFSAAGAEIPQGKRNGIYVAFLVVSVVTLWVLGLVA